MEKKRYSIPVAAVLRVESAALMAGSGERSFTLFSSQQEEEIEKEEDFL